jgi:hypothetical protein
LSTPALEILQDVLPCLRTGELAGIRKIWLLDREYDHGLMAKDWPGGTFRSKAPEWRT